MKNEAAGSKPNIVFVLTDDQGAWAMGCAGNHEIHTPNLDQIAAQGVRFANFFCTSPVCSPARASLFTGRIPSQHGVHDWIREGNIGPDATPYLAGQTAFTEILAENGYVCGISGKWHLGDSMTPQKGFTHWFVHQTGGSPYYNAPMVREGELVCEKGYITDVITDDALQFLEWQDGSRPFYLSVHYTAPHSPWIGNHPKAYTDLYADCPFETCPQEPEHPWRIPAVPGPENPRENAIGYYAAITALDANVGRILHKLDEKGLRDNTLVIFMSDNGFNTGHHGIWGKGNGTFPQNMYDTSVKVPALFSHNGRIPLGIVCEQLVSGYDFMPTLLDYVGLTHDEAGRLPGSSFLPLLLGEEMKERDNIVIYDEYGPVRMIRSKEWKYVHRYPYGPHELYHLAADPGERSNLIDDPDYCRQAATMKAQLEAWFHRYVDPALDGTKEAVYGSGQLRLAGLASRGEKVYEEQ
ncbi:sulfatase-like hydrolase/transferase [Paenibacillus apiarius]|uniref:sulfatase-like hydrolase/transferase n=1 Tax=Paenibacillus apiarius TaxID=46240 RepID=UPI00197DE400|nr:sulfatase-like hydrolase/transferase [Paenibacillus apiarius]MBN3523584.1 sulfatase-like hydrolase/transferase [Paenibacillus apiarius]